MITLARIAILSVIVVGAGACVTMPDFDQVEGTPEEFKEALANIQGYPEAKNVPAKPTDVPSGKVFDRRASRLLAKSDAFADVDAMSVPVASDMEAARRQLLAMVNAYKLDDPK